MFLQVGCCQNFVKRVWLIIGDDDNYLKLVHGSIFDTRQTEFAKDIAPVPKKRISSLWNAPWQARLGLDLVAIVRRAVTSGERRTPLTSQ